MERILQTHRNAYSAAVLTWQNTRLTLALTYTLEHTAVHAPNIPDNSESNCSNAIYENVNLTIALLLMCF